MLTTVSVLDRFKGKVIPEPNSGCWLWLGSTDGRGYGKMRVGDKLKRAHRIGYELFVGPIPQGMDACHTCDVTSCVNPDHLFLGTAADNMRDCVAKGRGRRASKTRCINGHDLTKAPSYVHGGGRRRRRCLECNRIYNQAYRDRRGTP